MARVEKENREETYRIFVSESLRFMPQGKYFTKSYPDLLKPHKVEKRSGKEVAEAAAAKMGIKINWGGES